MHTMQASRTGRKPMTALRHPHSVSFAMSNSFSLSTSRIRQAQREQCTGPVLVAAARGKTRGSRASPSPPTPRASDLTARVLAHRLPSARISCHRPVRWVDEGPQCTLRACTAREGVPRETYEDIAVPGSYSTSSTGPTVSGCFPSQLSYFALSSAIVEERRSRTAHWHLPVHAHLP